MPFEKKEDPGKILLIAALAEAPILGLGVAGFFLTKNIAFIVGAAIVGAGVFIIPAVLRVKRMQDRETRDPFGGK